MRMPNGQSAEKVAGIGEKGKKMTKYAKEGWLGKVSPAFGHNFVAKIMKGGRIRLVSAILRLLSFPQVSDAACTRCPRCPRTFIWPGVSAHACARVRAK